MLKKLLFSIILLSTFVLSGCHYMAKKKCCQYKNSVSAYSKIKTLKKNKIKMIGQVFFSQIGRHQLKVTANFKGFKPNQKFGFHVHEFGVCTDNGLMAGGHLNPWKKPHAGPQSNNRHLGDLGNLISDEKGQVTYSEVVRGHVRKVLGRSIIVHKLEDDLKSQASGNSGDRIACGIIGATLPLIQSPKNTKKNMKTEMKKPESMKTNMKKPTKETLKASKNLMKKQTKETLKASKNLMKKQTKETLKASKDLMKKQTKETLKASKNLMKKPTKKTLKASKNLMKKQTKETLKASKNLMKKPTKEILKASKDLMKKQTKETLKASKDLMKKQTKETLKASKEEAIQKKK